MDRARVLRVVAGILARDGQVLLAERPAGKELAGWLEFPGGKCESGEDDRTALRRELHEELGIVAADLAPFVSVVLPRGPRVLRLVVYRVGSWRGTARGLEGQALRWQPLAAVDAATLAPADRLVLAALRGT